MKSDRDIIFENIKKSLSGSRVESISDKQLDEVIQEKINSLTPTGKDSLVDQFAHELEKVNAEFIKIENNVEVSEVIQKLLDESKIKHVAISDENEIKEIAVVLRNIKFSNAVEYEYPNRKNELSKIEASILCAGNGIADIGSIVFYNDDTKTTYPHFLCDWTIIILRNNLLVANQFELIKNIDKEKAKNMVFVTGPSRTADIEKTLVLGAHGPRRVTVVLIP